MLLGKASRWRCRSHKAITLGVMRRNIYIQDGTPSRALSLAVREYSVASADLAKLANDIKSFFDDDDYKTQSAKTESGYIIQATKEDFFRGAVAADRAFTITLSGDSQKVKVSIGVGKWMQNLAVQMAEGLILSPAVFFLEVPVALWSYEVEMELWHFIEVKLGKDGRPPAATHVEGMSGEPH